MVNSLGFNTRRVVTLRKVHGLSEAHIAHELNLSSVALKMYLDEAAYQYASRLLETPAEQQEVRFDVLGASQQRGKQRSLAGLVLWRCLHNIRRDWTAEK